jgi:phosphoglycerate dehydrogenase-like enzyme
MSDRRLTVAVFNESQRWALDDAMIDRLRKGVDDAVEIEAVRSRAALLELLPETDYLMGLPLAESQFAGLATRLKLVQLVTAWAESLAPYRAAMLAGARVSGTGAIRAVPVAEHAMALLLGLMRRLDISISAQANRRWAAGRIAQSVREMADATVGLVNIGPVGREVARRLRPFGCEIIATGGSESDSDLVDRLLPEASIDELISRSDVLMLTDDDPYRRRPVLTRPLFEQMGSRSLLVNVAGGTMFAESEFLRAVRRGHIAGAALDCFEHRPLSYNSPLWNAANVIITPSTASASPSYWRRAVDVTLENIKRLESNQELLDELRVELAIAHA